jgi:hypothetical protein
MLSFKLLIFIALISSSAFAVDTDTLIFKIRNRVYGYPTDKKNYEFYINEHGLNLNTDLQGESYDNIWLWQTYNFSKAKSMEVVSPKLPIGCSLDNLFLSYVLESKTDFHLTIGFSGKSCIALRELLLTEKLKIRYTDVPVYDETRTKDELYMFVNDLHHGHMSNAQALKNFENYLNTTSHKTLGTYVAINEFPDPNSFDECKEIAPKAIAGDILSITMDARGLKSPPDDDFIHVAGEMSDRMDELFDPTGLNLLKRCTLMRQYLNPVPRSGLLKNAKSIFYYSLTNNFKMLMQTNAKK